MYGLLEFYLDVLEAKTLLESARANVAGWPDEADDLQALNDFITNIDQAINALTIPAEIAQAAEDEEAAFG